MKKNKILRLASVMLMLCLITTCAISGTFAKYTTNGTATDTARVAKWGVTITAATSQNMFTQTYKNDAVVGDKAVGETVSVSASTDVVAPGTTGTFSAFTISGTPEVAVNVSYGATLTLSNWTVEGAEYCPIAITVGTTTYKIGDTDIDTVSDLKSKVEAAIAAFSADYAAGTNLADATAPAISWTWAFDSTGNAYVNDEKDTALGNLATAPTITLTVNVTVTQIN